MDTYMAKPHEINRKWYIIDATDQVLGRLASDVAKILRESISLLLRPM